MLLASGNFRQTQHPVENLVRRRVSDLVNGDRIGDVESDQISSGEAISNARRKPSASPMS